MNHTHPVETPNLIDEPLYTPEELAKTTKFHIGTIRKAFLNEPGVIRLGHPARSGRRQYFTLRIPKTVAQRVLGRMTVGTGKVMA